eukprot:5049465-Ditylum_brightwellii.AAC.1
MPHKEVTESATTRLESSKLKDQAYSSRNPPDLATKEESAQDLSVEQDNCNDLVTLHSQSQKG